MLPGCSFVTLLCFLIARLSPLLYFPVALAAHMAAHPLRFGSVAQLPIAISRGSRIEKGCYLGRVVERWRLFFSSIISDEEVDECIFEWILFVLQTDLLMLQKKKDSSQEDDSSLFSQPILSDQEGEDNENESSTVAPMKSFPLALLLLYDPGEKRKRGLDQRAIEFLIELSKSAKSAKKKASVLSSCLSRFVCVVLEALRWYLSSVLGLFGESPCRSRLGIDLGQSVAQLVCELQCLRLAAHEMSDLFPVQWMHEIVQEEEEKSSFN